MRSLIDVGPDRLYEALPEPVRALARRGTFRRYTRNTILANEGEPGDSLFIVVEGRVKLYSNDAAGHEITYETVGPGECFGESCLDAGPRLTSALTLEPVACSVVGRTALRQHLLDDPAHALDFILRLLHRGRRLTAKARELALKDVYGRVVSTLEGRHGPARPEAPITLSPITHQTIASRIGASREMVSRLLKDLERGGYVELGVRQITLMRKLPARW
jgi:CRP/FNR family transcriptional regulator, cyclic AMP receptor protein